MRQNQGGADPGIRRKGMVVLQGRGKGPGSYASSWGRNRTPPVDPSVVLRLERLLRNWNWPTGVLKSSLSWFLIVGESAGRSERGVALIKHKLSS